MSESILILLDAYSRHANGGAGRVFFEVARQWVSLGCRVRVLCRQMDADPIHELAGVEFHQYPDISGGAWRRYRHYRASIREGVCRLCGEEKPDLLVFHSASAVLGLESLPELAEIPKIYYFHSPWDQEHRLQRSGKFCCPLRTWLGARVRKRLDERYMAWADGIIFLSKYMREEAWRRHAGQVGKQCCIIPGGVDPERFQALADYSAKALLRERLGLPQDRQIILSARRLVHRTGVDELLRAYAAVGSRCQVPVFMLILGDGELRVEYEALARRLGLNDDDVRFTGFVDEQVLADYYRVADIGLVPTRALEGFGLSTVEALACGLPVLGTDVGATPEILREIDDDLIITSCTVDSIAGKLLIYIRRNPEELFALGQWAAELIRTRYTWQKHAADSIAFARDMKV